MAIDALMVGAGEYTAGFVRSDDGEPASDKPAGVVAITLMDLRRLGKLGRLVLCDRDGLRMPAVRETLRRKIGEVYKGMDVRLETFPEDSVDLDPEAYLKAMDTMKPGDVVTIFTPDDTHCAIAMAAIQRGLHVLVAKPAVKTMAEHEMLVAAARKHKVLVAVEFHKRFDPIYSGCKELRHSRFLGAADARDRIATLGTFSFFSSTMAQPKKQLHTFAGWAGRSSDISYYLNSHHVDFLSWSISHQARPLSVVAAASTGVADVELARARQKHAAPSAPNAGAGSSQLSGMPVEDTISLMVQWETEGGQRATSLHMASWIAPPADCHTQQYWHYMGHTGELRVDQAHRGFNGCTDDKGFATLNPLYMKYTPDSSGRFAGQQGYGYRSIAEFVEAARQINRGERTVQSFTEEGTLATIDSLAALYTTAILEAGRKSLNAGGAVVPLPISRASGQ